MSPGRQKSARQKQRRWPAPSHSPTPQPKSQSEPVPVTKLACTKQTPNAVLLWIRPSNGSACLPTGASGPLPQGHQWQSELSLPLPPHATCRSTMANMPVPITELACTTQTPNSVLLWIHPSDGSATFRMLQGPSCRGTQQSEISLPHPPLCTLQIHPS